MYLSIAVMAWEVEAWYTWIATGGIRRRRKIVWRRGHLRHYEKRDHPNGKHALWRQAKARVRLHVTARSRTLSRTRSVQALTNNFLESEYITPNKTIIAVNQSALTTFPFQRMHRISMSLFWIFLIDDVDTVSALWWHHQLSDRFPPTPSRCCRLTSLRHLLLSF